MTDMVFIEAFKKHFIAHLQADYIVGGPENQAKAMVDDAIKANDNGKLSRIFDALKLPIINKEEFREGLAKAGNIKAYMRPILNEVASVLLNINKSRLHDDVIKAIGTENYAKLVSGEINSEGMVVAKKGEEEAFKKKEADVARVIMSSVLLNYSQSLEAYNLSPKEKELRESSRTLFDKIKEVEKVIKKANGGKMPDSAKNSKHEPMSNPDLDAQSIKMAWTIKSIEIALDDEDSDLVAVFGTAQAFRLQTDQMINSSLHSFMDQVTSPLQVMTTDFNLEMLEESTKPKLTLETLKENVETFYEMVKRAQSELQIKIEIYKETNIGTPLPPDLDTSKKVFDGLIDTLNEAREIPDLFLGSPADTIRDQMQKRYDKAVNDFVNKVDKDILRVEPPRPVMNIFLRILRAIFIFSLKNEPEQKDQHRFEQETNIKKDLESMKNELRNTTEMDLSSTHAPAEEDNSSVSKLGS